MESQTYQLQLDAQQYEQFLLFQKTTQQKALQSQESQLKKLQRSTYLFESNDSMRDNQNETDLRQSLPNDMFDWELPIESWIPDNKVRLCFSCQRQFTIFVRKSHCRKCGRVFCAKCIRERTFNLDGSRMTDAKLIKQREAEVKHKLRSAKLCEECDQTFQSFETGLGLMSQLQRLAKNDSIKNVALLENIKQQHSQDDRLSKQVQQTQRRMTTKPENSKSGSVITDTLKREGSSTQIRSYVKKINAEEANLGQFRLQDDAYKRLSEFYNRHIQKVVGLQLLQADLDVSKWYSLVLGFVQKAVEQIRPSSRILNDSMNLNDFVKIKLINWKDQSMSQYVNGVVLTKNLADRRMQSHFTNPSILLLKNTLELINQDLQSEMDQEEHLIKILSKKIEQIAPQIVIVEQDVTYRVMCMLRDEHKISVISKLDAHKMTRVSRITQTITANGVTVIDRRFRLGQCKEFKIVNQNKLAREHGFNLGKSQQQSAAGGVLEDQFLMTIDGCNQALGGTIVISGPPSQHDELKKVKQTMRKILTLARSILLEKYFLIMLQIEIPQLPRLEEDDIGFADFIGKYAETDRVSPFLITQKVQNRPFLAYQEFVISLRTGRSNKFDEDDDEPKLLKSEIKERHVHQKIDKICGRPSKKRVVFYKQQFDSDGVADQNNDLTLGQYLELILSKIGKECEVCQSDMGQHGYEIYHGDGSVFISVQQRNRSNKDEIELVLPLDLQSTKFSLECKKCGFKKDQDCLPAQVYEFSMARFLEFFFYNKKVYQPIQGDSCRCWLRELQSLRDMFVFAFEIQNNYKIQFVYKHEDVYKIQLVLPKNFDTKKYLKLLADEQSYLLQSHIGLVREICSDRFTTVNKHIELALKIPANSDTSLEMLQGRLLDVSDNLKRLQQNVGKLLDEVMSESGKITKQVFSATFLYRKMYINMLSFQRVFLEMYKVAALLIILCKRRSLNVLTEQLDSQSPDEMIFQNMQREQPDQAKRLSSNCFVEELLDPKTKIKRQQRMLPGQSMICPISGKYSPHCCNPHLIVQLYSQICDEVNDQYNSMFQSHQQNKGAGEVQSPTTNMMAEPVPDFTQASREISKTQILDTQDTLREEVKQQLKTKERHKQSQREKLLHSMQFYNPYITMALGVNNIFIQVSPDDVGSIIAYALNSNVYFEALAKLNYMGLESKLKKDKTKNEIDQMLLIGKDDVFDSEQIDRSCLEHEMLQSTKIDFKIKFSTHSKDASIRIRDNRKELELNHSSIHFKTGNTVQSKKKLNDLQSNILPSVSKEFLKNAQCSEALQDLEQVFTDVTSFYFDKERLAKLKQHMLVLATHFSQQSFSDRLSTSLAQSSAIVSDEQFVLVSDDYAKSAFKTLGISKGAPKAGEQDPQAQQMPELTIDTGSCFKVESPSKLIYQEQQKGSQGLCEQLEIPLIEFELKILYPKRFEALRRFYCGTHSDFISSIFRIKAWAATGGRTNSQFHKTHDDKYVLKEVKKSEFKMFVEFGPTYFDYMVKAFFHNYPCALAKILGAYSIKIRSQGQPQIKQKKYILVLENLNLGIGAQQEPHIVRYDLKGSQMNRLVQADDDPSAVLQDSNLLLNNNGRPILLHRKLANLLHICINNDSLCLQKTNIIDYSLLVIIDTKVKRVRFGIIDYLQMYTMERYFETQLKKVVNLGIMPTIIEPKAYRMRFTLFTRLYLVGVDRQNERSLPAHATKNDLQASMREAQREVANLLEEEQEVEESSLANSPVSRQFRPRLPQMQFND